MIAACAGSSGWNELESSQMASEHVSGEVLPPGRDSFPIPTPSARPELPPPPRQARQLTAQQFQAALAEASGMPRKDIAKITGVSQSTIKTWRDFPEYRAEIDRLRDTQAEMVAEPVAKMREELVDGVRAAIRALIMNLNAEDAKGRPLHTTRRDAAELLLKHGIELHKEMLKRNQESAAAQAAPTQAVQVVINTSDGPPSDLPT